MVGGGIAPFRAATSISSLAATSADGASDGRDFIVAFNRQDGETFRVRRLNGGFGRRAAVLHIV